MLMYLSFSNVNSIHWIIKKIQNFMYFSGHFMTIFRSNYFHLKLSFFNFFLNNCYIYANVFKIFKCELNPLDNKKDISLYVLFRTFSGQFSGHQCNPVFISLTNSKIDSVLPLGYTVMTLYMTHFVLIAHFIWSYIYNFC